MTQEILVLGGGPVGHALAARLHAHDQAITFVDADGGVVRRAQASGVDAYESTLESASSLTDFSAQTVVVATASDARNLLLATAARDTLGADRIVALLNKPHNQTVFADAGIETVCVSDTLADETTRNLVGRVQSHTTETAGRERVRG